jgi:hypothetical protein
MERVDLGVKRLQGFVGSQPVLQVPAIAVGGFQADEHGVKAAGAQAVDQFVGEGLGIGALVAPMLAGAHAVASLVQQDRVEGLVADVQTDEERFRHRDGTPF